MLLERVVVNIVLLLSSAVSTIAEVTSLMLIPAMGVKLIVSIEALSAEATFGVTLEPALVYRPRIIIAELFMPPKFWYREQIVLMCEDLLVPST